MTNEMIGAIFAQMGSDTQAEFFNGLGRMARLSWRTESGRYPDVSAQCFHILKDLDQDGKKIIRELAAMVGSEEEEAQRASEKRQEENARIVSRAEQQLSAVMRLVESWANSEEDGFRSMCAGEILALITKLETKP